mmetsp:Transcript_38274/g.120505  ORF Transcript_38274/g.120505 Transcript_38274/m.120505 type:complete len:280 (-) Transcript_38274:1821-2660(-)
MSAASAGGSEQRRRPPGRRGREGSQSRARSSWRPEMWMTWVCSRRRKRKPVAPAKATTILTCFSHGRLARRLSSWLLDLSSMDLASLRASSSRSLSLIAARSGEITISRSCRRRTTWSYVAFELFSSIQDSISSTCSSTSAISATERADAAISDDNFSRHMYILASSVLRTSDFFRNFSSLLSSSLIVSFANEISAAESMRKPRPPMACDTTNSTGPPLLIISGGRGRLFFSLSLAHGISLIAPKSRKGGGAPGSFSVLVTPNGSSVALLIDSSPLAEM